MIGHSSSTSYPMASSSGRLWGGLWPLCLGPRHDAAGSLILHADALHPLLNQPQQLRSATAAPGTIIGDLVLCTDSHKRLLACRW